MTFPLTWPRRYVKRSYGWSPNAGWLLTALTWPAAVPLLRRTAVMCVIGVAGWVGITSRPVRSCSSTGPVTVGCIGRPDMWTPTPSDTRQCPACDVAWPESAGILCWACGGIGVPAWLNVTSQHAPGGFTKTVCDEIAADVAARGV